METNQRKSRIFLAGDSTVQAYSASQAPQNGWGQRWYECFRGHETCRSCHPDDSRFPQAVCYELADVILDNRAMAGRSSRSFREEGRLADIEEAMGEGDWLLVQFGHNDANTKPERFVPSEEFGASLAYYADVCRRKKAVCVLVTPIAMRDSAADGSCSFPEYREAMIEYAKKAGLPLLDLGLATARYCLKEGPEACKRLFLWVEPGAWPESAYRDGAQDDAHLQKEGARVFARLLSGLIRESTDERLAGIRRLLVE